MLEARQEHIRDFPSIATRLNRLASFSPSPTKESSYTQLLTDQLEFLHERYGLYTDF